MRFDTYTTIVRDGQDVEISVEYDATPITPATYWQPAEGGEIEILAVFGENGIALDPPLNDDEEAKVYDYLVDRYDDRDFDMDEDWDAARDRDIDDRLTGGGA